MRKTRRGIATAQDERPQGPKQAREEKPQRGLLLAADAAAKRLAPTAKAPPSQGSTATAKVLADFDLLPSTHGGAKDKPFDAGVEEIRKLGMDPVVYQIYGSLKKKDDPPKNMTAFLTKMRANGNRHYNNFKALKCIYIYIYIFIFLLLCSGLGSSNNWSLAPQACILFM